MGFFPLLMALLFRARTSHGFPLHSYTVALIRSSARVPSPSSFFQRGERINLHRKASALGATTCYTIPDDGFAASPEELRAAVTNHVVNLDKWIHLKPTKAHTEESFVMAADFVQRAPPGTPIILDSGCGTGRSSIALALSHPQSLVIGVDRSLPRLRRHLSTYGIPQRRESPHGIPHQTEHLFPLNLLLIQAELSEFWLQALSAGWNLKAHYILYPNPNPKRLKSRWHGHPAFPLILMLGGDIIVRSNWRTFLSEFSEAVVIAHEACEVSSGANSFASPYQESAVKGPDAYDPTKRDGGPMTNFEQKFSNVGESCFELVLKQR